MSKIEAKAKRMKAEAEQKGQPKRGIQHYINMIKEKQKNGYLIQASVSWLVVI